ncbi:hypothetical protein SEPCBS57363_005957 [Sporothrix epigloea]|uniref:Zn(2)-C6 fungal-type domain-containing protein n=1 Tax=Sporothrix epigloea TaxID=1892477 RepID=A0ABP0E0E6_9PEZI
MFNETRSRPRWHNLHEHETHSIPPPRLPQLQQHFVRTVPDVASHQSPFSGSPSHTPFNGAVLESAATLKDRLSLGIGPKIWTGQDFLPRFLRVAELPGEGTCYFYDDGTHCKAVIDGEAVNPYWGVTKAGKPRKRLAIACITCREKKIKCDPEYPRCVQCEKFGRLCRFKNAPRGGSNNGTSAADSDTELEYHRQSEFASSGRPLRSVDTSPRLAFHAHLDSNQSPRAIMPRPLSSTGLSCSGNDYITSRKRRSDYDHYTTSPYHGRSSPFSNRSPTFLDVSRGDNNILPLPYGCGNAAGSSPQSSQLPPPPSSHPRSQEPYFAYSQHAQHAQRTPPPMSPEQQHAPRSRVAPSTPPTEYDHRHRYAYPHRHDHPHSQPASPSKLDMPRAFLPPPRSTPELPRVHDNVARRPW